MDVELRFQKVETFDSRDQPVIIIPVTVATQDDAELLAASLADAFDEFAGGSVRVELVEQGE